MRGKWSDDNEYVVMLRVQRRRVVISYIICNWSQSIVSISPWSPPSPTPPHLGQEDCTLYVQMYYLLAYYLARDTDSSKLQTKCSVLLKVDNKSAAVSNTATSTFLSPVSWPGLRSECFLTQNCWHISPLRRARREERERAGFRSWGHVTRGHVDSSSHRVARGDKCI